MEAGQQRDIEQFYKDFSDKVKDIVVSLEFVSLEAEQCVFEALNLKKNASGQLWGLLVFCSKNIYFYVVPYESSVNIILRRTFGGKRVQEQLLNITELDSLEFKKPPKKWYDFLFYTGFGKIDMEFYDKQGNKMTVHVSTQHKADVVLEKIAAVKTVDV
ncbi:hypothetical protein HRI96_11660 [Treponema parvum]|uniref:Uncharacterized protein n=1 Tax=Treponema parvum TaxID=138851 RepID=A0A975IE13_9SPIR|nr:hypothetical protein [Treponema parvum]QTQ12794.1 hypothetical protein HRI96_11660 [Treponema parvum]